ncbi:SCO family protein [Paenirhodobacter sp.]|uniref:SCO family protein n=1 Tax=Paenirhodobacter sp. TaxID=1965326 RepID=UPI003B3DFF5D
MRIRITTGSIGLIAAAAIAAAAGWFLTGQPQPVTNGYAATIGKGGYRLTTTAGAPFTAATLRGAPSVVFFGYTYCPDVCPTTLGDITQWQEALGPRAGDLGIYFITVDPERDTLDMLADYLSWSEGITGVAGDRAETDKAMESFAIYARRIGDGPDYTVDHTAYVMLFDRSGDFVGTIGYQEPEEQALPKLIRLLD